MLALLAAGVWDSLVLSARQRRWLALSLIFAGYGNVIASIIGAFFGVRGLAMALPFANLVVYTLFVLAIVGVLIGVVLLTRRRAGDPERRGLGRSAGDTMLHGKCLCEGVRYEIAGELGPLGYCHCSQCRRASGSAFGANADATKSEFRLTTGVELIREFESSPDTFRAFCTRCGSPIYKRSNAKPDVIRIGLRRSSRPWRARVQRIRRRQGAVIDDGGQRPQFKELFVARQPRNC